MHRVNARPQPDLDAQGETMTTEPNRRGRPHQQASEELVRRIVRTAARLFIDQGYAATSIEQVAAAAGSGKKTIYHHFKSKEGLFTEVIDQAAWRLLEAAEAAVSASGVEPTAALKAACRQLFDFVLNPNLIELERILVAEAKRFPSLSAHALNSAKPMRALLKRLLTEAMDAGEMRKEDPHLSTTLLISLFAGEPTKRALFGIEFFASAEAREAYFEGAWQLFARGMR
jgi:AcrR family transcriptional regulator